jgi:pilus assembly protein CpaC
MNRTLRGNTVALAGSLLLMAACPAVAQQDPQPAQAAPAPEAQPPVTPPVPPTPVSAPSLPAIEGKPLELAVGSSRILDVPGRIERVVVVQPDIADTRPVSPDQVVIVGRAPGTTDVVFRLESGQSITHRLKVSLDNKALESHLEQIFGVKLEAQEVDGTVVLRGRMPNIATGAQVHAFMDTTKMKWVDATRIAGVQQVQLRVRIAEASRTALRELAVSGVVGGSSVFGGFQAPGGQPFQQVSVSPAPLAKVANPDFRFNSTPISSATTLFGGVPGADLEIFLQALTENRYIRLLAEPNLVAMSGETATFLVGGEFPIPIVQGSVVGGGSTVTIEYKEYGIRLNFRPEVVGEGKLRLEVAPEVSELSAIGALQQNGFEIPSLATRRSKTTVELGNGQSFAMAGLLRTLEQSTVARVPVLGDIPVLGTLFRSVRYEQAQTELVVIVTAELVEPLNNGMDRPMPGDLHEAPNDWELFMEGEMHGAVSVGHPLARLKSLGLGGLKGPGAWRRPDQPRVLAADPMPGTGAADPKAAVP